MSSGSHFWNLEPTGLLYCLRLNQPPIASDLIYCVCMMMGFPSDAGGKDLAASAGDMSGTGSIPGSGRSPEGGNDNPVQYSCLENPMERGAWQATVHRVTRVGHNLATKERERDRESVNIQCIQ